MVTPEGFTSLNGSQGSNLSHEVLNMRLVTKVGETKMVRRFQDRLFRSRWRPRVDYRPPKETDKRTDLCDNSLKPLIDVLVDVRGISEPKLQRSLSLTRPTKTSGRRFHWWFLGRRTTDVGAHQERV